MKPSYDYIIVGAGIAGMKAVEAIRRYDGDGSILLINGEDRLPYKRTRISKNIHGGFERNAFAITTASWFETMQIDYLSGRAKTIALKTQILLDENKEKYRWRKLILCNGTLPVLPILKGNGKQDIMVLRTASDAEMIISKAQKAEKILVSGGGVLGIEIAAEMVLAGKNVSLVHRDAYLMNKHFDSELSKRLHHLLQEHGIQVILQEKIDAVSRTGNDKILVEVGGLIHMLTDMVIFSVGVMPDISIAKQSGLSTNRGIKVNEFLETSYPNIYAAGDVAEHPDGNVTGLWHAAENQGTIAGSNASGEKIKYQNKPYRLKLEVFDQYYFSMNVPEFFVNRDELIHENHNKYYHFFFEGGKLSGLLMANDKPMAKTCETAVKQNWTKELVVKTFIDI
ncbi:MAG: hypothetical protein CVT92_08230 [Bacteroidetes bacterium HGW-Bacteroidetes-1]|nr:MAG: hypothetical protein CVT92_08230 [Bacteroidetes bacterium HGW-Bacteroidetes-1]